MMPLFDQLYWCSSPSCVTLLEGMESKIFTYKHEDGEIEKVEAVTGFNWDSLSFVSAPFTPAVVKEFARLYRAGIIPKNPEGFGTLVFFHLVEDGGFSPIDGEGGEIYCLQGRTARFLNSLASDGKVWKTDGGIAFEDGALGRWFTDLESKGYACIVPGFRDTVSFVPLTGTMGFLSSFPETVVNSQFFLMEWSDRDSPYDVHGLAYGLRIDNGTILSPPLFHREALAVFKDGAVKVICPKLTDLIVSIGDDSFIDRDSSRFRFRPEERVTPESSGTDLVIINRRLAAVNDGGRTLIPMGGFVISLPYHYRTDKREVSYTGLDDILFAVQAGPALIKDGVMATELRSPFYKGEGTPFPPTVYPLSFDRGRAARIGLGAKKDGSPVLLWAEGAGKTGHIKGEESGGASLKEFALICKDLGLWNLVNLDGGGSAQISHGGKRKLKIADRYPGTKTESERPVPSGIIIRESASLSSTDQGN